MAIVVWRDPEGEDHYNVVREGKLYPFGTRESAEFALAMSEEEFQEGHYGCWDRGLPWEGWSDVTAEIYPDTESAPAAE